MKEYMVKTFNFSDANYGLPDIDRELKAFANKLALDDFRLVSMTQNNWYYTLVFEREARLDKGVSSY